jgi:hypothetical protein
MLHSTVSRLIFQRPSHLTNLRLIIRSGFQGKEIEIPDSVVDLHCLTIPGFEDSVTVLFHRDSHVRLDRGGI